MKSRKKRGADAPAKVKNFILYVTTFPLESIQEPLSQFSWDFEKGDFHHWSDLFYHFDSFFEKYVKPRKDLQLEDDVLESNEGLPKDAILQILRVTRIILENCANKYLYRSHEHVMSLLASMDSEVVIAALQTLAALVRKPVQSSRPVRWHGDPVMNGKLFSLSQGWGGKEEGLGLLSCAVEDGCDADVCRLASTLHFEFYADGSLPEDSGGPLQGSSSSGLQVIHIPDVHLLPESDLQLFKQLLDQYHVPTKLRFSLFTRLRFARAFHSLPARRQFICIRLLAFTALLQSNPDHEDLMAFFVNEPEFVNELVALLQSENTVPEDIRILAVLALAAQAQDRPRQSNVLTVVSAGGHRGILPSLVQKAVASMAHETGTCSVAFADALLSLVTVLVSSSSGCAALREAGLISTLLPLLKDTKPQHVDLVTSAVHILEAFMDYSNPAGTLFRDLGGLDDTIMRLQHEVSHVEQASGDKEEDMQVSDRGKDIVVESQSTEISSPHEVLIPYRQRLLLKALLRAIALGTYASGNTARLHGSEESALPACLCSIFRHAREFGGGVFSLAASVMSDLINKDPTCFPILHAAGLPAAFLESITAGVLPSSDAVGCIPHALDALCLNNVGLQAVKDCSALQCFVKIFTSKSYLKALGGDTPAAIASGLDELMRHAPSLRGPGVDACIDILKAIAVIGGAVDSSTVHGLAVENPDTPTPMETDSEEQVQTPVLREEEPKAGQSSDSASDTAQETVETFLPDCINNTVQMLETVFQNADTCRVFIEKKGIEDLLRLFTLPRLPVTFGGSSTAYNMFLTFRAFSSQHASTLTKTVCNAFREHLKSTLVSLESLQGCGLSDVDVELRGKVLRHLSACECFLSLTAFLVRSIAPMMTEINTLGNEVFNDIGSVHRWVLWQISVQDDKKVDVRREEETTSKATGGTGTGGARASEDEAEALPVLRYINPNSRSRWAFESDLIPLLPAADQGDRRSRREHVTTELLNHVARLGRLARHAAVRTVRGDMDTTNGSAEALSPQEPLNQKSADSLNQEMLIRLGAAARGLYVGLGKAMTLPSRRRDDAVTVSPVAKSIASSLAVLFLNNLQHDGFMGPSSSSASPSSSSSSSSSEASVSIKCRYLGKVVEDITAVVIDNRKRSCNTVMVNCLYALGTIKQLLITFEATSQLLWSSLQNTGTPMDTESGKMEAESSEAKIGSPSWLLDTLRNYARLLEHLVTSSTLLVPSSMAQLLVQPVTGGTVAIPKDPEKFVLALQAQVLDVVFPIWSHPLFSQCRPNLIECFCSILKHIYSGVSDAKGQTNVGASANRLNLSPPDEGTISRIVEMGFSRSRAEEALRRVGHNSVEAAMEWLISHPEEASEEDDELARALALSLGSGSGDASNEDTAGKGKDAVPEEVGPQPPPVEAMLSTCMNLLNSSNTVAFPLADLLITMCTRSKGQDRAKVISYLIQHLKYYKVEDSDNDASPLSTISHLIALILSEDSFSREVAAENGVVSIALDILSSFKAPADSGEKQIAPKWVTALLLVFDYMLQYKPKVDQISSNQAAGSENAATDVTGSNVVPTTESPENAENKPWEAILGKQTGYMAEDEQLRTMSLACGLLTMNLPATTVQAVLQLCARLTKSHRIAMQFLDAGGLSALLSLPRSCLFPGFENVAAAIIRHLLEDPQTLQQAMESEIRHSLTTTQSRHNGRLSPRVFLTSMARVVARDPAIFLQAAATVCQIEESSGRPYVILAKEKEKEKEREKEKADKDKPSEKERERGKSSHDETPGGLKGTETGGKLLKGHKKVPHSFSHVLEQLLDVVLDFVPLGKNDDTQMKASSPGSVTAMEVDEYAVRAKGKAKVDEAAKEEKPSVPDSSAAVSKVTFILKLITEVILMYSAAVSVVLRRDTESSQGRGACHGSSDVLGHGGLLYHVLHRLIPNPSSGASEKTAEDEAREKLSSKAAHFLVAVCMRSAEGRRRLFLEIAKALTASSKIPDLGSQEGLKAPDKRMRAFVDLLNTILSSHTSSGGSQAPGVSAEMAKAMLDAGMVHALTLMLQVIDLDHPDAPKLAGGIAKALEALTRAASASEHTYGGENNISNKNTENAEREGSDRLLVPNAQASDHGQHEERISQAIEEASVRMDLQTAIRAMQALVGGDTSSDGQIDHDMGLERDGDVHLEAEDEEFMHDAAEVAGDLEDVGATATVTFRMERADDEDDDDEEEEEDMDGDGGEEEDDVEEEEEEGEDEEDLEDDEVALSPPETDVEDHDLEEEYDEDMAEEEEVEEDEWRENRIIEVRWRDGTTGFNHVHVLGQADVGNNAEFTMDPFQGMNIDDLFGAFRRTGGIDRRRGSAYRTFDRGGSENTWTSRHPLLSRPNPSAAPSGGLFGSSSWTSAGIVNRETDAVLGGGMDVTRLYMYDNSMVTDHIGDSLFGDRGVGGQGGTFLDFPMYPVPRMGRRNSRADSRFSSWTDDSQLQGGAYDVALAQAIEQQFVSQVSHLTPADELLSTQPAANGNTPAAAVDPNGTGAEQSATAAPVSERQEDVAAAGEPSIPQHEQQVEGDSAFVLGDGGAQESQAQHPCNADLDVHMDDERSGPAVRDVEAASQDSSGSGATVGESLRSLEVEIGSVDGHDEMDRHGSDVRPSMARTVNVEGRPRQADTDEDMEGPAMDAGHAEGDAAVHVANAPATTDEEGDAAEHRHDGEGTTQRESGDAPMSSIDPAFLEALPEDLRAEVLASQQRQTTRVEENHQPSAMEDIDPEFLAALPPEIQAEVLAQQQAQRLLQAQQVEGQPVDMDSASIIATFPAELREEVLLTSSDAVLAALPPALLAEARLLRERAMNQFQARTIFGGAHRLGNRRNSIDIGGRGVSVAIDRGVGAGSNFPGRRLPSSLSNGGNRGKEDGKPLVDTAALKAILRLLRLAQPLGKGLLQRLLYNLCANSMTCSTLVQLLLDMLRPDADGLSGNGIAADGAPAHRLYGCQWNVVYARPQLSNGVPPLVSRRVLEILTYLAKHQSLVAYLLLYFEAFSSLESESEPHKPLGQAKEKGKGKVDQEMAQEACSDSKSRHIPLVLLLKLLNQPLYSRSSAHLEQVLGLIEVVTTKAGEIVEARSQSNSTAGEGVAGTKANPEREDGQEPSLIGEGTLASSNEDRGALESQARTNESSSGEEHQEPSTSGSEEKIDLSVILLSLPSEELRKLCLLLACEGLSELAYSRVSEVLSKLADLAPPHRRLFITELADAARNLSWSAINELKTLGDTDTVLMNTGSMVGAAILRVLSALSALTSVKEKVQDDNTELDQEESLLVVRDLNAAIEPLWQALSSCAGKIETRLAVPSSSSSSSSLVAAMAASVAGNAPVTPPLSPGTQRVLPFIEAFFVLCDKLRSVQASLVGQEPSSATACEIKEAATSATISKSPSLQQRRLDEKEVTFIRFADRHRRLLNAFVRQNPGLLEKSLSLLLKTPRLIDFDNKRAYFRSRITQQHEQQHYAPLRISVRRAYVLEDSYNQLRMRTSDELKGRLTVQFQGEEGIDAGGLTREWYQLLSRVIFDKGALLFTTVGNESSFQPNPNSVYQTEHLSYFKFVGRVVAKALFDGQLLDVYFTRSFYKHILGVKVTYHDIEAVDPDFYKNLKWVLENVVSDMLGLTFSIDADEEKHILYERTEVMDHELIPGGRNVRVTEENKHEYVDLVAEHRLTTAIRPQIIAFLEGFNELVSKDLISIFNDKELELLISGLPEIDLEDLRANTEYTGYTAASSVVQWFWEVVQGFSKEDMARLLQFITGTSKVPLQGFRGLQGISGPQKFQIHKAYGAPERLPSAHTCFNQLDLPEYSSKEQLEQRLLLAIHEGSEGFGFG